MAAFQSYRDELASHGIDLHPSELHGLLIGYLCAVQDSSTPSQRAALYANWTDGEPPAQLVTLLEESFAHTLENLGEYADFEFTPLMPEDDSPIDERVRSLALWCSGFLSGYGEAHHRAADAEAVTEVLRDLARIAAVSDEVPAGEDNEADLIEIIEFVRVSALLVFAESVSRKAH